MAPLANHLSAPSAPPLYHRARPFTADGPRPYHPSSYCGPAPDSPSSAAGSSALGEAGGVASLGCGLDGDDGRGEVGLGCGAGVLLEGVETGGRGGVAGRDPAPGRLGTARSLDKRASGVGLAAPPPFRAPLRPSAVPCPA
ncbi:hypothetical protein [Streptomyces sp. KR80]|uniref:hypothetical protein n=1 Tax=Streptomyces sp. KR80 TaxID=3457426 RepID=UPI003FD4DC15